MHESPAEIQSLQALLDRSFANAGEHYRSIHVPGWRLTASEVCELLTGVAIFDLATVSSAQKPYVAPVDGLFLKSTLWFASSHNSLRFKHIRTNPQVSAAYTQGEDISIVIHGVAHEVDTSLPGHEALHDYCVEIYGPTYDAWGYWGKMPYAWLEPTAMYASRPGRGHESKT